MKRSWLYAGVGSFLVTLVLLLTVLFPVFDKRSLWSQWTETDKGVVVPAVGAGDPEAFIWVPGVYGGTPGWRVNRSYAMGFLQENFQWRLMASPNNVSWYPANELLNIRLVWDNGTNSFKVTLTLDTSAAPQSLYYRFDMACNKSLRSYLEIDGYSWRLVLPANMTVNYTVLFDWSDIKPLKDSGKIWFDKGVQENFFWFRVQTVNKIAVGKVFVVDPVYGIVTASDVSSWEFDAQEGRNMGLNGVVRVNSSEYYLTVACGDTGTDNDGFLRTLRVWGNNGTIKPSVICSYEYDTTDGRYANVRHIPGTDKYVVAYKDTSIVTVATFQVWANNGTIRPQVIDSQVLSYLGDYLYLLGVTSNVFVVSYADTTDRDGFLQTIWVNSSGTINNTVLDTEEYRTGTVDISYLCMVDSDTVAMSFSSTDEDGHFWLMTYNISSSGAITDTPADSWSYAGSAYYESTIDKINDNVFVISYCWQSFADFFTSGLTAGTVTISDAGKITKSWIDLTDPITIGDGIAYQLESFLVHDPMVAADGKGILGVTFSGYTGGEADGWLFTWNVTSAGVLGDAVIGGGYQFDTVDDIYYAHVTWVNQSWYLIVYTSTGNDGWSKTVKILTNWDEPSITAVAPAHYAIDVHLTPSCNITVNDTNADSLDIMWETFIGGAWTNQQVNNSIGNGTYRFIYDQATSYSTLYSWRVSISDGFHNVSSTYAFTTEDASASWQVIDSSMNGSIKNITRWQGFSTSLNGSIKNITRWTVFSTGINGSIKNITRWSAFSTSLNGSIKNISVSAWNVIDSSINGSIKNITAAVWTVVSSAINGSIKNITGWRAFSTNINGSIRNITRWFVVDSSLNGSIKNITVEWNVIDSSVNGSIKNISIEIGVSPLNIALLVHNPNPGNGTHGKNYLKSDATGLTASVDVVCINFTTPPATLPGAYNVTINSTAFTNTPTTWNTSTVYNWVWDNATGGIAPGGIIYTGQLNSAGDYTIFRSFLRFDTSILPDNAIITSGYIKLVIWQDFSDTDFNVTILDVKTPKPHNPLIPGDYSRAGIATIESGHTNTTGYGTDDVFTIKLKQTGLNAIEKEHITNYSVRSHKDMNQTAPGAGTDEWITFYGNGLPVSNYPKLIINYTVPSSNWDHIVNLTFYNYTSGLSFATVYVGGNGTVTVPAPVFDGVGSYYWNVSWNRNHTIYGNSSVWSFETVTGSSGSLFIMQKRNDNLILGISCGVLFAFPIGLVFFNRRRKREDV